MTRARPLAYGSVCSGIEAATVAWHPLGWQPVFFAEIDRFPSAVLAHHYPDVPNLGDFTAIRPEQHDAIDLLVGGTPCQSFSIAGLRGGLADDRGNLALEFLRLADRARPRWLVWENVPGVLSSNGGRDFGAILGGMVELGYGFAYRVLDAQFVRVDGYPGAVPQRRRRVFVVGYLGDWRRAAAVLFERACLLGDSAPRREAGQGIAPTISARTEGGGGLGTDFDCDGGLIARSLLAKENVPQAVSSKWHKGSSGPAGDEVANLVAHSLRADGFDASEDGTGRGTPVIPIDMRQASRGGRMTNNRAEGTSGGAPGTGIGRDGDPAPTLARSHIPAIAFDSKASGRNGFGISDEGRASPTLRSMAHKDSHQNAGGRGGIGVGAIAFMSNASGSHFTCGHDVAPMQRIGGDGGNAMAVATAWAVRRLTPAECERLQGFPDGYTDIPWRGKAFAPDGPRYKALGNSMAVNCMRWIGRRIAMVESLHRREAA